MKKLFAMALFCGLCMTALQAQDQKKIQNEGWEAVQLAFWENFPVSQNTVQVCGVRAGLPVCGGKAAVHGVDAAFLWSSSETVNGLQTAPFAVVADQVSGLQFSIVNWVKNCAGVQLGVVNFAKGSAWQIGLFNFIEDSPLPFMIICNVKF